MLKTIVEKMDSMHEKLGKFQQIDGAHKKETRGGLWWGRQSAGRSWARAGSGRGRGGFRAACEEHNEESVHRWTSVLCTGSQGLNLGC